PPARCVLPGTGPGGGRRRPGRVPVRVGRAGGPAPPSGRLALVRLVVAVLVVEVEVGLREQPVAPGQHRDEHADHRQGGDDHPDRPALVVGAARGELRRGGGRRLGVLVDAVARDEQVVDGREGQLAGRLGRHLDDLDVVVLVLPGRRLGGRRGLLLDRRRWGRRLRCRRGRGRRGRRGRVVGGAVVVGRVVGGAVVVGRVVGGDVLRRRDRRIVARPPGTRRRRTEQPEQD